MRLLDRVGSAVGPNLERGPYAFFGFPPPFSFGNPSSSPFLKTMARLCVGIDRIFTDDVLKCLHTRRIRTTIEFLKSDPHRLAAIAHVPYKDIMGAKNSIISKFASFATTGKTELSWALQNSALVPTGIESLDKFLGGGFLTGHMYEICGVSASCKTQLCYSIAINLALTHEQKVYYIDTKSDFSSLKVADMMEAREIPEDRIMDTLRRIEVTKIKTVFQLTSLLNSFRETIRMDVLGGKKMRCIILDSLPSIFYPCINSKSRDDGMVLMDYCANMMKYLSRKYHLAVIVVNLAVKNTDKVYGATEKVRPALGKHWLHIPSSRFLITRENERLHIKTMKSIYTPLGCSCILSIGDKGIYGE